MEYRNSGAATHYGKGIVTSVDSTSGLEMVGSTLAAVSDSTRADIVLKPKGTGGAVYFGGSTSGITGMGRGIAAAPVVALPASAIVYSTITIPGVAVGDSLFISRSTGMSTALGMAGSWVTGADEGSFAVINNLASTASILAGATFPYFYVKA